MITIFTPTYNRGYIIEKLYLSLCNQSSNDFEWLVVDDGSTDNTRELIERFITDNKINVRYIYKENGGKHTAINLGVINAKGVLFFIVDSDDQLTPDAVDWIITNSRDILADDRFTGLSGLRINPAGTKIGGGANFGIIDADALTIRYKYNVRGDLAEIYKTEVLRQFPFPIFENEKFVTEALVWNRIANAGYSIRYFYHPIYICQYRIDGLSAQMTKLRITNPQQSTLYYSEYYKYDLPILEKIKAAINYWRFSLYNKSINFQQKLNIIGLISLVALPLGCLYFLYDKKSIR